MDVCTLVIVSVTVLHQCVTAPYCEESNGKRYCVPLTQITCPAPPAYYECLRPDASSYTAPWQEHPIIKLN